MFIRFFKNGMDNSLDKKTLIFETTLDLVREHGIHGFPMSEVAKKGKIAVGTIYHYFEGKDQLIRELYLYVVDLILQVALKEDDDNKSFKERYFIFWNNMVHLYHMKPSILSFFEFYRNSSYYVEEKSVMKGEFYTWLFSFFEQGLASGEIRRIDKRVLAVLVLSSMHTSASVKIHHFFEPDDSQTDFGEIAEIIWEGIRSNKSDGDVLKRNLA